MQSTYKDDRKIPKMRTVLLVLLFTVSAVLVYSENDVFYKEFRYRIERTPSKSAQSSPHIAIPSKNTGIVLESRMVNNNSGLGRGGWQREKRITLVDPNDRDLEAAYINSPRSWYSHNDRITIVKTSDNRWYWWGKDGSLHFYAMVER